MSSADRAEEEEDNLFRPLTLKDLFDRFPQLLLVWDVGDRWPLSAQIMMAGKSFLAVAYSSGRIEILSLALGEVDERRVRAVQRFPAKLV